MFNQNQYFNDENSFYIGGSMSKAESANNSHKIDLMPKGKKVKKILHERAKLLAMPKTEIIQEERSQYLRVRLGRECYAIQYQYLDEVFYAENIVRVPFTPPAIAGVINRRGELLTVLELKQFFHIKNEHAESFLEADKRIVIVHFDGKYMGLLVDGAEDTEFYMQNDIVPSIISDNVSNIEYVEGIYNGRVTLINVKALFSDLALVVNKAR